MTRNFPPAVTRGWRAVVRVLRSPLPGFRSTPLEQQSSLFEVQGPSPALQRPLDDLSSVLFPSPCRVCGDPLLRSGFAPVCANCIAHVRPQDDALSPCSNHRRRNTLCGRCGEHLGFESWLPAEQQVCEMCRLAPPPFVRAVAFAVYQDELRAMLHLLKYDRIRAVATPLGAMLAQAIAATIAGMELETAREMIVVAVPLFATRERQRGFNQTVLMCDVALQLLRRRAHDPSAASGAISDLASWRTAGVEASRTLGWPLKADHRLLERCRETESQFRLTPSERRANLRGAFETPHPEAVRGKHILLLDDIFTTGSTARECASTLLLAGALSVRVATLSRAQPEGTTMWDTASFAASVRGDGIAPH